MRRAVVIGQSHCNAIAQALAGDPDNAERIAIHRIGEPEAAPFTFSAALPMVAALPADTPVFISALGTYHSIIGLLESGERFDFLLDPQDSADQPPTARVPNRAIASAFEAAFDEARKIKKVHSVAQSPIYLLSTPPPKQSNDFIKSRLMALKGKVYRDRSVLDFDVERPEIRLKLWRLETRLLAAWAKRAGMTLISAPAAALNDDGYLREDLYDDATHANAEYGAMVVDQITAILDGEVANG